MSSQILIVDDDPVQRRLLHAAVTKSGYDAIVAEGGEQALKALEGPVGRDAAVVILDLMMPGLDGNGLLRAMRERGIAKPVIVQTAQGGIDTAVAAMRAGAFDFVVKPASPEKLLSAIRNAMTVEALEGEARRLNRKSAGSLTFKDIITISPTMERVLRLGQKAASSNIPILIEGESGVGKELVARAIRGSGERRSKPFVTVNCGAIPENLVESILFGHEKAHLPVRPTSTSANSSKRIPARSSSTRLEICRCTFRSNSCARFRTAKSIRWVRVPRSRSTSG
jgi:DNA-binding NtrC family response regulator